MEMFRQIRSISLQKEIFLWLFSLWCIGMCLLLYRLNMDVSGYQADKLVQIGEQYTETVRQVILSAQDEKDVSDGKLNTILSERENSLNEMQENIEKLRNQYAVLSLLEEKEIQAAKEICPDRMYEKYFQLKQGELARIVGEDEIGMTGYLNSHFSGRIVEINWGMFAQYDGGNEMDEFVTPYTLLIKNPDINIEFGGVRAGMNFEEIWKCLYETQIQTGFMYTEDYEIYYLEYENNGYCFRFLSDQPDGTNSWIEISEK